MGRLPEFQEVTLREFQRTLRSPLVTAHGTITERRGWLIELSTDEGTTGLGECTPLPEFGGEKHELAHEVLQRAGGALAGQRVPARFEDMQDLLSFVPDRARAVLHAIEGAMVDVRAQLNRVTYREVILPRSLHAVPLCVLAAGDSRSDVGAVVKMKAGTGDVAADIARAHELARAGRPIRVDANAAWSVATALEFIKGTRGLSIELLEDPITDPDPALLRQLRDAGARIAADEYLFHPSFRLRHGSVDAVIIKPQLAGGIRGTIAFAEQAQFLGMGVSISNTIDGDVALAAAAQLAAALPVAPIACGLGTRTLLEDGDAVHPYEVVNGEILLPQQPGLALVTS